MTFTDELNKLNPYNLVASQIEKNIFLFCNEGWRDAETRLVNMRERMAARGIAADAIQPEWCHQVIIYLLFFIYFLF